MRADPLQVLRLTRRQAFSLADEVGRKRLRSQLEQAQLELNARISQAEGLGGPGKDSFTATQLRATLRQIEDVLRPLTKSMRGIVVQQAGVAADTATRDTLKYLHAAERKFRGVVSVLPLKEAAMFDRARNGTEASVLSRLASNPADPARMGILQRYDVAVVEQFENRLREGLIQQKPWADVRADLIGESPFLQQAPAHWAERIVRTETMGAFNRAGWESTQAANEVLGDMVKILSATFDERTGWDSYQVHGQIRRPDEPFDWNGRQYQHPPNRPNDREVVVPHRLSWPLPAELKWRSDGEVSARWRADGRLGSPPPRPRMTTVPLERFATS